eukprot:TRINITY_DN6151_c0_g1_i1.p1 TRINITY_DN6151_c0_g1~~TRINITY_DN6151_c0_g1_i1.p1  ORF type:complete len:544 (-),score=150.03 TRINITY_DN6151_c0_g1_i1:167-1798(-)
MEAFAKLRGPSIEYHVQKLWVSIGRASQSRKVDVAFETTDRSVSRKQAVLFYNFSEGYFEIRSIGRHPIIVDGNEVQCGHSVPLHHHSRVEISEGLWFTFMLPIVALKSRTFISSSASLAARKPVYRQRSIDVLGDFDDDVSSSDTEDERAPTDEDDDMQTCSIALFKKELILSKNVGRKKRSAKSDAGKKEKTPRRKTTPMKQANVSPLSSSATALMDVVKNETMMPEDDAIVTSQSTSALASTLASTLESTMASTSTPLTAEAITNEPAPTTAPPDAQSLGGNTIEGEKKKLKRPRKTYAHIIREALLTQDSHEMLMEDVFAYFMEKHEFYRETEGKLWKPKVIANVSQHEAFEFVDENETTIRLKDEFVSRDTTRHVNPTGEGAMPSGASLLTVDEGKGVNDESQMEVLPSESSVPTPIEPRGPISDQFVPPLTVSSSSSSSSSVVFQHQTPGIFHVQYVNPPNENGEPPIKRFKLMEPQDGSFERVRQAPVLPTISTIEESGPSFQEIELPRWDSHNPLEQSLTAARRAEHSHVSPEHL